MENAEAGPSRPPPPVTPAPSKKEKRRSWFGLSSPSVTTPKKEERERKNSVIETTTEELELGPVVTPETTSADGTGAVASHPPESRRSTDGDRENGEEVLTIDRNPDPDRTIKKKKKRWSSGVDDDYETVRMDDLSSKGSILDREKLGSRSISDRTVIDNEEDGQQTPHASSIRIRTFSRTASDRDAFFPAPPIPPPQPHFDPIPSSSITRPTIKPRTSSMTSHPSPTVPSFVDKSQPPIPVDIERPLPPLPPSKSPDLPAMPHGIVVTPSSPAKLTKPKTPKRLPASERRSRSATGRQRESSQGKRSKSTAPSSRIGLGLPSSLLPSSRTQSTEDLAPPPVPSKPQSVSSPLPSRSASPIPKITFVEPDQPTTDAPKEVDTERRNRVKRARSLSGIFGKSPPAIQAEKVPTPDSADQDTESTGKSQGMLEWLGMRKTIKRRQSEAKLKDQAIETPPLNQMPKVEQGRSRESLNSEQSTDRTNTDATEQTPRRPDMRAASSTVTVVPQTSTPGKLANLFSRRASAKGPEDDAEPSASIAIAPRPIPNAGLRGLIASSESSFSLPAVDPVSPFVPEHGHWVSSPGSDGEETLFSPGGSSHWGPGVRPWMDATEVHQPSRSSTSSPLEALPEQELLSPVQKGPSKAPANVREGRVRSWSDAPLPPHRIPAVSPGSRSPAHGPASPSARPGSPSLHSPARPGMGSRSNSGNSAIIGRMRSVFSKSTTRSRSNSLLRQASSDADEFGALSTRQVRPSTSSSSTTSSVLARGRSPVDDRPPSGISVGLGERSSRTSFTPSISSLASGSPRNSLVPEQASEVTQKAVRKNRARASTMMTLGPTSYNFTPPSPGLFPSLATPPRRRPGTMTRLSNGLFGSGPSSPRSTGLFPLPPRSSGSISSATGAAWDEGSTGLLSPGTSPRPSTGSVSAAMTSSAVKQASVRESGESPSHWLDRVVTTVGRHEIADVLAASGDEFHTEALEKYMATFDFTHNALDVALRRLLMHMSLPKETQQIDRVIEAFSKRYEQCEPGLFGGKDNTYVLAFSMMILHTDAFNKHNKNKMTKVDYVRNTRMDGVLPLVLEAFFDNITFTPFVFIEDDSDLKRSSGYESASSSLFGPSTPTFSSLLNGPNPTISKSTKVDVYHMIVRGLLGTLRVDVEKQILAENPFSCLGTRPFLDCEGLSRAFASAHSLMIPTPTSLSQRKVTGKLATPAKKARIGDHGESEMVLRVTKAGLLSRRDDGPDTGKKANRKWKSWSVILTGSQILFFKDPTWALTLLEQAQSNKNTDENNQHLLLPRMTTFKPDEVFPVKDCIAVYDSTFTSHPYTFRFVMPHTRQYLMQAPDEFEMNEWVTLINYASAFKTAGLKMRSGSMRKDQVVLAGAAAAASHRRELRGSTDSQHRSESSTRNPTAVFGEASAAEGKPVNTDTISRKKMAEVRGVDVDGANERVNEGEQLEEVFGAVKAELAAGRGAPAVANGTNTTSDARSSIRLSEEGSVRRSEDSRTPSAQAARVGAIYAHLTSLRGKAAALENTIHDTLLLVRNLAILTPFQVSTRDRIAISIPPIAHRIRSDRLTMSKLRLWIKVLEHEAEREDREWKIVRHVALQAAARSMREDGVEGVVRDVVKDEGEGPREVPVLALPIDHDHGRDPEHHHAEVDADKFGTSPGELPIIFRRTSDEPLSGTSEGRPTVSRQTTGMTVSTPNSSRKSSTDLLSVFQYDPSPDTVVNGHGGEGRRSSEVEYLSEVESRRASTVALEERQDTVSTIDLASDSGKSPTEASSEAGVSTNRVPTTMFAPAMESPVAIGLGDDDAKLGLGETKTSDMLDEEKSNTNDPKAAVPVESENGSTKAYVDLSDTNGDIMVHPNPKRQEKEGGGGGNAEHKEEAEEWQFTRAAKRVSLVHPGEMSDWEKMSMRKISGASAKHDRDGRKD
ncbi:hypothetical protein CI109_105185 [Kwoniella shandongensis]|uniref:Uncharacterized protein n=1 Tax=Kwoniella shandongensis TaxID=1734106 RepID=A0A5M6C709_9TREE|nr:uncharacterized protein CI109_002027 [Kwoniella shandongensis]KAA5529602.1 hypothetical protein CI109_002027 [Kwoniella shandongensis]